MDRKNQKREKNYFFCDLKKIIAAIFSEDKYFHTRTLLLHLLQLIFKHIGAVRANSRLKVEEKQDDDIEFYIREWLRHSQGKCDRERISPASYEDPIQ